MSNWVVFEMSIYRHFVTKTCIKDWRKMI